MTDQNSVSNLQFAGVIAGFLTMLILMGLMFGVVGHQGHLDRVRDCQNAFGDDATPIETLDNGDTLCHVGDGIEVAPDTGNAPITTVANSFLSGWPSWALVLVSVPPVFFFATPLILHFRGKSIGG